MSGPSAPGNRLNGFHEKEPLPRNEALFDRVDVEQVPQGAAHVGVVERLLAHLDDPPVGVGRLLGHRRVGHVADRVEVLRRHVVEPVDLAAAQAGAGGGRIGEEGKAQLVERRATVPVALVGNAVDACAAREALERERTGAVLLVGEVDLAERLVGDNQHRLRVDEELDALSGVDLDGEVVDRLGRHPLVGRHDRTTGGRHDQIGIGPSGDGVGHVGGRQRRAVVEGHVVADLEDRLLRIGGVPLGGEPRNQLAVGRLLHQRVVEHEAEHLRPDVALDGERRERRDNRSHPDGQTAADVRR